MTGYPLERSVGRNYILNIYSQNPDIYPRLEPIKELVNNTCVVFAQINVTFTVVAIFDLYRDWQIQYHWARFGRNWGLNRGFNPIELTATPFSVRLASQETIADLHRYLSNDFWIISYTPREIEATIYDAITQESVKFRIDSFSQSDRGGIFTMTAVLPSHFFADVRANQLSFWQEKVVVPARILHHQERNYNTFITFQPRHNGCQEGSSPNQLILTTPHIERGEREHLHLRNTAIRIPLEEEPASQKAIGDITCVSNAKSAYIRCAVNPVGPCEGCKYYEPSSN